MALERLGPYRLERILGRGGMGTVYAARHETTGEVAAVKALALALAEDAGFQARFQLEIETLKKLRHPHIVQIYGFGEQDGLLFYAMELVNGHSLQDELTNGRRFTWREVTRFGVMIAQALKHAHDRGIIHRDLKPANLLLDEQEQIKLADFGIAKLFGSTQLTMVGGVIGTADYMSPEQADGKSVTTRSDLFSLGAVLYALLSGRPPFAANSVTEVLHGLKTERAVSVKRIVRDIPEELDNIIMQLLEKNPSDRIATARTVANRLQAMEHALSIETRVGMHDPPAVPAAESPRPTSPGAKTNISDARVTADMPAVDPPDYQLSSIDQPTVVPRSRHATEEPELTVIQGPAATGGQAAPATSAAGIRTNHFITMAEAESRKAQEVAAGDEDVWSRRLSLAGIVVALLVLAGIAWFATRPATEEQLQRRIELAAEQDDVQALLKIEHDLNDYLRRFGESQYANSVKVYLEEVELYRLEKQFDFKARRLSGSDSLLPVERAYLEAMQLVPFNLEQAITKLDAIPRVFGGTEKQTDNPLEARSITRCVELARMQAQRLRQSSLQVATQQRIFLRSRMEETRRLANTDPAQAQRLLQGIIDLYADQPWAEEFIVQARQSLAELSAQAPLPDASSPATDEQ